MSTWPAALRAAFFDLDGTLMDREPLMEAAVLQAYSSIGLTADDLAILVGRAWPDVHLALDIERRAGHDLAAFLDLVLGTADDLLADGHETRVLDGGVALIHALAGAGVPVLVVTGSLRREADVAIAHLGIGPSLAGSIAAEDYRIGKPAPECYRLAASGLGLDAADARRGCVVFEDSEVGVRSGLAAGMCVVATGAANRAPDHPSFQHLDAADVIVDELTEVTPDVLARALAVRR